MKNTVKLYECWETTGDGHWFSLEPAYNPTHPATGLQYDDYSCGEPQEYELPDGFEVAETGDGIPAIYDADGCYCGIAVRNGRPVLIGVGGIRTLKQVEDEPEDHKPAVFQQYELEAFIGSENLDDFDIDAIIDEATEVIDGNRYWVPDVDLNAVCQRHDLSAVEAGDPDGYHVSWTIPGSGNIDGDDFATYEEAKTCFDRMCLDKGRDAKLVEMLRGDELVMSSDGM